MNKQAWLACAQEKGFTSFEIYQAISESKKMTWYQGAMDTCVTSKVLGTSIRGIRDGKMANMALETTDDDRMESVLDTLAELACAISSEDITEIRRPEPIDPLVSPTVWVRPAAGDVFAAMKTLEEKCLAYDPRVFQVTALRWIESASRREILNSYGMDLGDDNSMQYLVAGVAVRKDDEIKNNFKVQMVPDLAALDLDTFVKELCDEALLQLGAVSVPSGTYPVIIERHAMSDLFDALTDMFSGELIGKGLSPLKDKMDTAIFSPLITVVDDPRRQDTSSLFAFDDEGCATCRKVLVDGGIFRKMLHNTKSARRLNTDSTGNGFKAGYASDVMVVPMNCSIMPGDKSLDALCEEMGEGLVILDLNGLHAGINHVTTDFSLQCAGYRVRDGRRAESVTLITIAGNFLELMKHVVAVGSDLDFEYRTVASPSIYFESCAISGS